MHRVVVVCSVVTTGSQLTRLAALVLTRPAASIVQDIMVPSRSRTPPRSGGPQPTSRGSRPRHFRRHVCSWNGVHVGANGEVWMLQEVRLVPFTSWWSPCGLEMSWTFYRCVETWVLVVEAPESNLFLDGTLMQGQRHLDGVAP